MSTPQELLVPFALTPSGELVPPVRAVRGSEYRCPGCQREVGLRGGVGTPWRVHFFHLGGGVGCTPETVLHRAAKRAIVRVVRAWAEGSGPAPEVEVRCPERLCGALHFVPLAPRMTSAREEVPLPSGRRVDVGLLIGEEVRAAVEIRVTHAVDEEKRYAVETDGVRVIELDAESVLGDPLRWRGVEGPTRTRPCPDCTREGESLRAVKAPEWVRSMRLSEPEEAVEREVLRKGRVIVLQARQVRPPGVLVGEKLFYRVEVAELDRTLRPKEWRGRLSAWRDQAESRRRLEALPAYAVGWLIAAQAIQELGGRWRANLAGEWRGRVDVSDPDENRARWIDLRRIAGETRQMLPDRGSAYWAEPFRCYRHECRAEMLVYGWRGRGRKGVELPEGEAPPGSLIRIPGDDGSGRWVNRCPVCDKVQGDPFVYEPLGPLRASRGRRGDGTAVSAWQLFLRSLGASPW